LSDLTIKDARDDSRKKLDEYLKEFDKISSNFEKSGSRPKNEKDAGAPGGPAEDAAKEVAATRLERNARPSQPRGKQLRRSGLPEDYDSTGLGRREAYAVGGGATGARDTREIGAKADGGHKPPRSGGAAGAGVADALGAMPSRSAGAGNSASASGAGTEMGKTNSAAAAAKQKKAKKRRRGAHPVRVAVFILLVFAITGGIAAFGYVASVIKSMPEIDPNDISSILYQNSTLYDDEGNVVDDLFFADEGLRTNVTYDELPQNLVDAIVAIEDKTFWTHNGFNFIRMAGAIRDSVLKKTRIRGTSTITQQLARNIWLVDTRSEYDLTRKLREALYAMQLENKLTKKQILEAYLNTIPLGNRSYGVQAAAQAYFSKDVKELGLVECAALASLPQAPTRYALVQAIEREKASEDDPNLLAVGAQYAYVFNDAVESRKNTVLDFMLEQGYISESQREEANSVSLRDLVKPRTENEAGESNYFADYTIKTVIADLQSELGVDEDRARQMVYGGGLKIYTTLDSKTQKLIESEFENNDNFPKLTPQKDKAGDILNVKTKAKLLYDYGNCFDEEGYFALKSDEYELQNNGDLLLMGGKRLNFYTTNVNGATDYSVEFKDLFVQEDKTYYFMRGGVVFIGSEYKTKTEGGDLLVSKKFFDENPSAFEISGDRVAIRPNAYTLRERVVQPQSAMALLDYKTGAIKAMAGGRNVTGRLLYNRATSPRQPGSAIKPMSVYGPALQMGADGEPVQNGDLTYGDYWTAASGIVDEPMASGDGSIWPKNWYSGFRGMQSLRRSVEQSVNVNAVKVLVNIGADRSLRFLKNLGVTTVVESGRTNDMNAAALALGGMTNGISPLQMAAGYGSFGNEGKYVAPRPYYRITTARDEPIIDHEPYSRQAMDPGVAWLMTDILRTTVTNGIASRAAIPSQPVAGKTGTTSDKFDAWFVGFTPRYSASLWIGCDMGVELAEGSAAATKAWSKIMKQVCDGTERGSFPAAPPNITTMAVDSYSGLLPSPYSGVRTEYFIKGTEPTQMDNTSSPTYVCAVSGYLATPYCPARTLFQQPAEGDPVAKPSYYCNLHNHDAENYPIDPAKELISDFYWDGVYRDAEYYDRLSQSLEETDPDSTPDQSEPPSWIRPLPIEDGADNSDRQSGGPAQGAERPASGLDGADGGNASRGDEDVH
jgi:penicillin-binding protein 1A